MLKIRLSFGERRLTLHLPKEVDEITVEEPPTRVGNHREDKRPLIILTDSK